MSSKLYILYMLFMYMYTKAFLMLDKVLRKNIKKRRHGHIKKHKLNEMGVSTEYEIEKVKQIR